MVCIPSWYLIVYGRFEGASVMGGDFRPAGDVEREAARRICPALIGLCHLGGIWGDSCRWIRLEVAVGVVGRCEFQVEDVQRALRSHTSRPDGMAWHGSYI